MRRLAAWLCKHAKSLWRLATLLTLVWIGWELHLIREEMPGGLPWGMEENIESIERNVDKMADR